MDARKPNRLSKEASPYLLQHAHNPVEWWPWSDEALGEAKRRDVPILLSIGYSACHWCHVMERESFENEAIATLMNELFVSIKVDREERPDLDQIYQLVVQLMGKTGGWPLTVFLTPDQRPFYGGTYFPPEDRYGMPGFPKILEAIAEAYRERRGDVAEQADELTKAIAEVGRGDASEQEAYTPGPDLLERAVSVLMRRFDATFGGFGKRPKFPNTMPLELLLRHGVASESSREAARLQLESMRRGGIWDHLGGGFHRYSTDEHWLVPHFEKMLYDNALLLRSYVDGFRVFGDDLFAGTARDIAAYVAREMTDASGGFYASQDADSEGEEGKFFVWDITDVEQMFGKDSAEAKVAIEHFGITRAGNFEDHGRPTFKTVLHEKKERPIGERAGVLAKVKERLFAEREKRPKPFRDEKILTSWSALLVSSLADAGMALGEPTMLSAAERALDFMEKVLVEKNGRVLRLAKGDLVKGPGFLDDHAYLVNAAIDVYEATGNPERLALARRIADAAIAAFHDDDGFFFTPKDGESLITRQKDPFDNAVPSGFSMMCRALLRLGTLADEKYSALAEKELLAVAPAAIANPFGYGQSLCEMDRLVRGNVDVVLLGDPNDERTKALARTTFAAFLPNRTVSWGHGALAEGKEKKDVPVAYVCRGRTCSLPVKTSEELRALLEG